MTLSVFTEKALSLFYAKMRTDTRKQYGQTIDEFFAFVKKPIEQVSFSDAEQYRTALQNTRLKETTIIKKLRILRSFCEFIIQNREAIGLLPHQFTGNPFGFLVPLHDDEAVEERLIATPEELDALLVASEQVKVVRFGLLFSTRLMLKVSEFLNLTASSFFMLEDEDGSVRMFCRVGSSQRNERLLLVPTDLEEEIRAYIAELSEYSDVNSNLCLFFNRKDGKLYSGANLVRMLHKLSKACNLRNVTFNAFRNLGIALNAAPVEEIRDALGFAEDFNHEKRIENLREYGGKISRAADYVAITLKCPERRCQV